MSKVYKYETGAKLIYKKNDINSTTAIKIVFECGSRCDGELSGLAHFCEHMFFSGTKTENKQEITKQYFDFINVNAYTNSQEILFMGEIFTKELPDYLKLVAKMITQSTFSTANVESEKKVVLQEIVADSDDYGLKAVREFTYWLMDKDYYRKGVLGNEKSVKAITSKDVKNFVKKYFIANNCSVFVVSPMPFKKVKKLVEQELLSKLKVDNKFLPLPYDADKVVDTNIAELKNAKIDKNFLHIGFKVNLGTDNLKRLYTAYALCAIMSNTSQGVLKKLRLEKGLVYSAYIFLNDNKYDSALIFKTELGKANIKECIDIFADYIKELINNGISQERLEQYLRETKYYHESKVVSPKILINEIFNIKRFDRVVTDEERYKYRINVKKADIDALIKEIFNDTNIICSIYGDAKKTDVYTIKELKEKFNF